MTDQNYLSIYAKSFNWAGFFLPKQTYKKCSALYNFCRVADNIADDPNPLDIRRDKFIKFKNNFNIKNSKTLLALGGIIAVIILTAIAFLANDELF